MRKALVVVLVGLGVLSGGTAAYAMDRECVGTIGAVTVNDNLTVPEGATCSLEGTRVRGNVDVEEGATLLATGASVLGNVDGDGAAGVSLSDSLVGGRIQIVRGGTGSVLGSTVRGDLVFSENADAVEASDNLIRGSLQADRNTGGVTIQDNRIRNNLQCSENDPAPTGGGNRVGGNKTGQCEGL
jgi:hypothetical protein